MPPINKPRAVGGAVAALSIAAATAGFGAAISASAAIRASTVSPLTPPLGPCSGTQCPSSFPPPGNGPFAGRDASINVFAGGSFNAIASAAEAEGKVVVLQDMTIARSTLGLFNIGVAVGSRVPPPDGDDYLTVGRDLTVTAGNRMEVGGFDGATTIAWGNVRYGGTTSGQINLTSPGRLIADPDAADRYRDLIGVLESRSTCAAATEANGTVSVNGSSVTFTGHGDSLLQVFDVPGNLGSASSAVSISFAGIPAGATVVVNMLGAAPLINTTSGTGFLGDPLTNLRPRLLWNFPTATSATVSGLAQFQGSIIAGNPAGTLTVTASGVNGRVYAAGNILMGGSGSELHSYPFDGDLPDCHEESESPSASVSEPEGPSESASESEEPSESASPSESEEPSESASPSESEEPSESASPSESEEPSESASPSESEEPSESASPSESEEPSESASPSESEEPSESASPSASASASASPSESEEPSASASPSESEEGPVVPSVQPMITPPSGGELLAHTGTDVGAIGAIAALLLAAGAGATQVARRRNRRG